MDNFKQMNVQEDVEAEMRRLKLELKQTMEMYSTACKEALTAKQKVRAITSVLCHMNSTINSEMNCIAGKRTPAMEIGRRAEIGRGPNG